MYYEEANQPVVETSAADLWDKANPTNNANPHRRVVFVKPPAEFLGNREHFHVTRNYPTHSETWSIVQGEMIPGENTYRGELAFKDRQDCTWMLLHEFHHTAQEADKAYLRATRDNSYMQEALWQVIL